MKRIVKKIHHFTRQELAVEEIVIIAAGTCILTAVAAAATTHLPVRATIVQCGPRSELAAKCREDERCCELMDTAPQFDEESGFGTQGTGPAAPAHQKQWEHTYPMTPGRNSAARPR